MPCYSPLKGYRSATLTRHGKRGIVFNKSEGFTDRPIDVPCGQCIGCRLEKSRQWALRCVHESQLHDDNCFITLTYNDDHVPNDFGLDKKHFQLFMKNYRQKLVRRYGKEKKIRYFHCGEYGEINLRPHYHAAIFGHDFDDKQLYKEQNGIRLYTSKFLGTLWPYGFSTVGSLTFESAAYIARYVMKKVTGDKADKHYERVHAETGEILQVQPEYTTMSRRPGIGKGWYDKFKSDAYPSDFIVQRGQKMQPPKYYDELYQREDNQVVVDLNGNERNESKNFKSIQKGRRKRALKRKDENTTERLRAREKCKKAQIKFLKRKLDED